MNTDEKQIEAVYLAIGSRIRMIRETLGESQEDLARRAGISRPALVNMEVGRQRISLHKVMDLADALGTSPKNLMKGIWW